nr:recombinase [Pseudomonadaceae bacterium]
MHGNLYFRYHQSRETGTWYLVTHRGGKQWTRQGRWPEVGAAVMKRETPAALLKSGPVQTDMTLGDILTWYRDRVLSGAEVSPARSQQVAGIIDNHLLAAAVCNQIPADLTRRDLDADLFLPLQHRLKPATIRNVFRVLKAATKRAASLDVIGHDPFNAYRFRDFVARDITAKPGALRPDDAPMVLDRIMAAPDKSRMLSLLMVMYGTRLSETRQAQRRDFDLDGQWWHIPGTRTKNGRALRLPLSAFAIEHLAAYFKTLTDDHLFRTNGSRQPISRSTAHEWVKQISDDQWTSHDYRKMARTQWADQGTDYFVAEVLLNHTPVQMDKAYIHTYLATQSRDAIERYHGWLAGFIS